MNKILFTLSLLFTFITSFSQLNPINNLEYWQEHSPWTSCAYANCFSLDWETPDDSQLDTLVGYKIYRNNELYKFQDYISVYCFDGPPSCCPDSTFLEISGFYIKVTAVYNSSHDESIANDSIYIVGLWTNTTDRIEEKIVIMNNPIKQGNNIDIKFPIESIGYTDLHIFNYQGNLIKNKRKIISTTLNSLCISTNHLKTGIYFIVLSFDKKIITKKILII